MEIGDRFKPLRKISNEFYQLGNSYVYAKIGPVLMPSTEVEEPEARKTDGMILVLVKNGIFEVEINLERYSIEQNSFIVVPFGTLCRFIRAENSNVEIHLIEFTTDFLHEVNINFSAISAPTIIKRQSPAQKLSDDEIGLLMRYFDLFRINAEKSFNEQIEVNIASSLMAAMVYQLVQFHYKHIGNHEDGRGQGASRNNYVHDFIKLVHVYYTQNRSVAFYADKLCISTKYLSLLVKEVTGKSAARWIDEFVIMEAKNLLRFSGKNVQQVAYALNFNNQSSFGKFFKHMTGMSPTEYQKS